MGITLTMIVESNLESGGMSTSRCERLLVIEIAANQR